MNISVSAANRAIRDAALTNAANGRATAPKVLEYPMCMRCLRFPAPPVQGKPNDPREPYCRKCRDVAKTEIYKSRPDGSPPSTPAQLAEWLRTHPSHSAAAKAAVGAPSTVAARAAPVAQSNPAPVAAVPVRVPEPVAPPAPVSEKTYVVLSEAQSRVLGMMGDAHGLSIDTIVRGFIRDGLAAYVAERRAELDRLVAGLDADDTAP